MDKAPTVIGGVEYVSLPSQSIYNIPARIDTGAKTSSIWASDISIYNGILSFTLFDKASKLYNGHKVKTKNFTTKIIRSTNGIAERRYVTKLSIEISDRKIYASFTLANRHKQTYPVLVGRNILRNSFIIDLTKKRPRNIS